MRAKNQPTGSMVSASTRLTWYESVSSPMLARRRIFVPVLALACATGCSSIADAVGDLLDDGGDSELAIDLETREDIPPPAPDVGKPASPTREYGPLQRADRAYPLPAKGGANMGFRVDALAQNYALAGKVEVPEWSAPHEGDPELVRDDDLDTAWTCTPSGQDRCAIGIHFPTKATLEAVQLFVAGPYGRDDEFARPKRLRLHTDEGFLDALMPDESGHVYAVFGKDVASEDLTIEVLEVWKGRSPTIYIGELDVFGSTGEAREPLAIDPARTFVRLEPPIWRSSGRDTHQRQAAFVHRIDAEGVPHRLIEGTALRGHAGDRLMLVERLQSVTGCEAPRGTFYLLDTQTRLLAPLGEFGGVGGDVFRASDGRGIAVGIAGPLRTVLDGLFAMEGAYHRKRTPLREDKRTNDFITQWGLERTPLPRGDVPLAESTCAPGTPELLAELDAVRPKTPKKKPSTPGQWRVCDLDAGARAFLGDYGPCGPQWEVHVLDAKGTLVDSRVQARAGSHLGLRDLGGGTWLVQVAGATDAVLLLKVDASGIETFAESAALALEPPDVCRTVCEAGFRNPHAPSWE